MVIRRTNTECVLSVVATVAGIKLVHVHFLMMTIKGITAMVQSVHTFTRLRVGEDNNDNLFGRNGLSAANQEVCVYGEKSHLGHLEQPKVSDLSETSVDCKI